MIDDTPADLPCPICRHPVFAAGSVVLCSRCDAYQHLRCWTKQGRCAASEKCKGKPVPVAVVRLQPPGPNAEEIAAAVEVRVHDVVHPIVADLRSVVAHAEDLARLGTAADAHADTLVERLEAVRRDLDARVEAVRQVILAMEQRATAAPPPVDRADLARVTRETAERGDAAAAELREALLRGLADLRKAVLSEVHGVHLAVEACRWDTAARRQPMPWDARTDDVLAPPATAFEDPVAPPPAGAERKP